MLRTARTLALATLALSLFQLSSASAQYGRNGGMRGGRRGMMGGGGEANRMSGALFDPVLRDGPPAPDSMAAIAQLSDSQRTMYLSSRDQFMQTTKPTRDSLALIRSEMRDARANGEGSEQMRSYFPQMRSLGEYLARRQNEFDEGFKLMVTKDQYKRYEKWRKEQRKQAEEEAQRMMQGRRRGGPF
jgi:hypothetical protein